MQCYKGTLQEEFVYVNTKHFHLVIVLIICNAQMQLTNIVGWWPGSTYD